MKLLVTGLCTLHWARLEYGNIGNYYIIQPLFTQLRRVFPDAEIFTTFQMTKGFSSSMNLTILPMEDYYGWSVSDLETAKKEYQLAVEYAQTGKSGKWTHFLNTVQEMDLVVDFSGDMWGDNAEHVGKDRFQVELLKLASAQKLGKRTALFAVTPGPFSDPETASFAKKVFESFDLVTAREKKVCENLTKWGISTEHTREFACPAFLFDQKPTAEQAEQLKTILNECRTDKKPLIGFTLGGFSMPNPPYDKWPREDAEYTVFVHAVEHIICELGARVVLFSHTNGFLKEPEFQLICGRDYPIIKQLQTIVQRRGKVEPNDIRCIDFPLVPAVMHEFLGNLDMVVTGRVHASVAAVCGHVPTVFMTYEPSFMNPDKMMGYARLTGMEQFVCAPGNEAQLLKNIDACWKQRDEIRKHLQVAIPQVKNSAEAGFSALKKLVSGGQI